MPAFVFLSISAEDRYNDPANQCSHSKLHYVLTQRNPCEALAQPPQGLKAEKSGYLAIFSESKTQQEGG